MKLFQKERQSNVVWGSAPSGIFNIMTSGNKERVSCLLARTAEEQIMMELKEIFSSDQKKVRERQMYALPQPWRGGGASFVPS